MTSDVTRKLHFDWCFKFYKQWNNFVQLVPDLAIHTFCNNACVWVGVRDYTFSERNTEAIDLLHSPPKIYLPEIECRQIEYPTYMIVVKCTSI